MALIARTVFISYRRIDKWAALAVFKDLVQHGYDAFIDYDGIASGDFEASIIDNICARAHFVVLLTPSALDRCHRPDDWLRREIETAIAARRNVVPLLLDGFDFGDPKAARQLQGTLEPLRNYQALEVPDGYFDAAMDRLRDKFLATPVETVIHPASAHAQQVAREQQRAALAAQNADSQSARDPRHGSPATPASAHAEVGQPRPPPIMPIAGAAALTVTGAALLALYVMWPRPTPDPPRPPPSPTPAPASAQGAGLSASASDMAAASVALGALGGAPAASAASAGRQLAPYHIDIFWCSDAGALAQSQAVRIKDALADAFEILRLRVRRLTPDAGPWASGYEIRVDPDGSEDAAGRFLQRQLDATFPQLGFTGWAAAGATPNYLSVFVCPGSQSTAELEQRTRLF